MAGAAAGSRRWHGLWCPPRPPAGLAFWRSWSLIMASSIAGHQSDPAAITFLSECREPIFFVSVASAPADAGEINTPIAHQLGRLHGIDAPELDQTFWWRSQPIVCGTMSVAALEALRTSTATRSLSPALCQCNRHWEKPSCNFGSRARLPGRRYAQGRERYVQIMLWKERAPGVGFFARVQILPTPG
jgi:hypothetical protein